MSNEITTLIVSMKAAAEKAKYAGEAPLMQFDERITALNEFMITACPANVLKLIEAMNANLPHHNGLMQFSNDLAMAKQRIAQLERDCWTYENTVKKVLERAEIAEAAGAEAMRILESGERQALTHAISLLAGIKSGGICE